MGILNFKDKQIQVARRLLIVLAICLISLTILHFYLIPPKILDWYRRQDPPVKAAVIIGSISILTVCLGFAIKDYIIPVLLEKRKTRLDRQGVFKNYRLPLKESALSLSRRIDEIFRTRSHLLWKDNPVNDFYNYKIVSTNYRLCSLLGWIYAFRQEESYLQVPSKKLYQDINNHLSTFCASLADGQGVEMDVAKRLIDILDIRLISSEDGLFEKFSVRIDHLVQKAVAHQKKQLVSDTDDEYQQQFLLELSDQIKEFFNHEFKVEVLKQKKVIEAVSIRVGLIYRDWQQAVGSFMAVPRINGSGRTYDIISFNEFEDIISRKEDRRKLWLKRTMRLFEDLDVSQNSNQDTRIKQLEKINAALKGLIDALEKCPV